jgi:hypothetical protein
VSESIRELLQSDLPVQLAVEKRDSGMESPAYATFIEVDDNGRRCGAITYSRMFELMHKVFHADFLADAEDGFGPLTEDQLGQFAEILSWAVPGGGRIDCQITTTFYPSQSLPGSTCAHDQFVAWRRMIQRLCRIFNHFFYAKNAEQRFHWDGFGPDTRKPFVKCFQVVGHEAER